MTDGIFTETDKEYLRGEAGDMPKRTEYNRRQVIRERLVAACEDLELAYQALPEADRNKIRNEHSDELMTGLGSLTALSHELLVEDREFKQAIQSGIYSSKHEIDPAVYSVNLEIETKRGEPTRDISVLKDKLETHGESELSPLELGLLYREGELNGE